MASPADYTDGDIIADSFVATIETQSFVVNNLSLTTPVVEAERNDETGALAAKRIVKDVGRTAGTAELQIDATARNIELWGTVFEVPADANSTGVAFSVIIESETSNVVVNQSRTRSVNVRRLIDQPE